MLKKNSLNFLTAVLICVPFLTQAQPSSDDDFDSDAYSVCSTGTVQLTERIMTNDVLAAHGQERADLIRQNVETMLENNERPDEWDAGGAIGRTVYRVVRSWAREDHPDISFADMRLIVRVADERFNENANNDSRDPRVSEMLLYLGKVALRSNPDDPALGLSYLEQAAFERHICIDTADHIMRAAYKAGVQKGKQIEKERVRKKKPSTKKSWVRARNGRLVKK